MAETSRVEVEILGQKYTIRSAADPDYVRELAGYVEKRALEIRGISTGHDAARLLALASLYIADELFRLRDEHSAVEQDASSRLEALRHLLDTVIAEA